MWVKGFPLYFIVDGGSQKNIVSAEVVKWVSLPTTTYPQLGMEESLPLLWIFRFFLLDLGGGNGSTGLHIDNFLPFIIPLIGF